MDNQNKKFKGKRKYLAIYGLEGFHSNKSSLRISDDLVIRKISDKKRREFYDRAFKMGTRKSLIQLMENEFFLFYTYEKESIANPQFEYDKLEEFRRLFRTFKEESIDMQYFQTYGYFDGKLKSLGFHSNASNFWYNRKAYEITNENLKDFKKFSSKYLQFDFNTAKSLEVAVRRLDFSCQRLETDDKIIDLMIGFEALFSKESSEITYRLALRTSCFLSSFYDRQIIFEFMKKCYAYRSSIVHGSHKKPIVKILDKEIGERYLADELRPLLRLSIQLVILNYTHNTYKNLIDDIDKKILGLN